MTHLDDVHRGNMIPLAVEEWNKAVDLLLKALNNKVFRM